jgi:hypothetical protein
MKKFNKKFIPILLVLITLIIRIPFLLEDIGFNNDAIRYSRNFTKTFFSGNYDVHMPGYISYIYFGKLIYKFTQNVVLTQHIINMILIVFIIILFYKLLQKINFSILESFLYTILFSFNIILMLGSLTGGNRLFLSLCSISLIILSIDLLLKNKETNIYYFSFLFAFFIGFRQDIFAYFLPLMIYLFFKIQNKKKIVLSLFIFFIVCLSWFIPLMIEYGGILSYIDTMKNHEIVQESSVVFSGLKIEPFVNIFRLIMYTIYSFLLLIILFTYTIIKKQYTINKSLFIILILSFLPSFLFQLFVHNGNLIQLSGFIAPFFILLIYKFKLKSNKQILIIILLCLLTLFQCFGLKPFSEKECEQNKIKAFLNISALQYTYESAKNGYPNIRFKMLIE